MSGLGDALMTARRARAMTQQELATAAGVTQAALSRYENDMRDPDEEVLHRLATALGVTAGLLKRAGRLRGAMAVDAHMRRRKTAKPAVWRRLEARLNMLRLHAHQLFEEISLNAETSIPMFDPLESNAPDSARLTRMQWRMPVGPVRSLVTWMEAAGCVVVEEDFGTPRVDGLSQWIGDHPVVLVNVQSPTDRKRLTLAHELGHLCLHSEEMPPDVEEQANSFAAEFLMPAETIRPQLRNLTLGKLHDLKREWGVSMQALIERAHGLGTLTATQRARLYKRFSVMGWRTREPLSDQLASEEPRLVQHIGDVLVGKGLSLDEIAHMAGFADSATDMPFRPSGHRLRAI